MPGKEYSESTREEARRLRDEGVSYAKLSRMLGAHRDTIRCWCEDKARKKRASDAYRWNKNTERGRVQAAIGNTRSIARRHPSTAPCTTSVDEILSRPKNGCEICGDVIQPNGKRLYLDHDHTTGEFRGWLCMRCNNGIGLFRDSPNLLIKAANYLTPS